MESAASSPGSLGQRPSRKLNFVHFKWKIWHLVTISLVHDVHEELHWLARVSGKTLPLIFVWSICSNVTVYIQRWLMLCCTYSGGREPALHPWRQSVHSAEFQRRFVERVTWQCGVVSCSMLLPALHRQCRRLLHAYVALLLRVLFLQQ